MRPCGKQEALLLPNSLAKVVPSSLRMARSKRHDDAPCTTLGEKCAVAARRCALRLCARGPTGAQRGQLWPGEV
eukprot:scaffold81652_cov69-Phaeocystis_antarctica.AAC.2